LNLFKIHINLLIMKKSGSLQVTQISATYNYFQGLLLFVFVFLSGSVIAQEIVKRGAINQSEDKILIVTNRSIQDEGETSLAVYPKLNQTDEHRYLIAQGQSGSWVFQEEDSFPALFNHQETYTDWVVFIHGDGKNLETSVIRAREIQKLHKVNVLIYSWPSKDDDMNGIKNFKNSYKNVENSAHQLFSFFKDIADLKSSAKDPFQDQNVSLFLHSLGNYYLERLSVEGLLSSIDLKLFNNLIINAAAVEQEGHNLWVEEINFAERIYINSNDDDMSLSGLRFLTKLGRQLGESALEPFANNAIYVDFTEAVGFPGMGPSHSYYFASVTDRSENIRKYYTTIFHGNEAELENKDLFTYLPEEPSYFIIF